MNEMLKTEAAKGPTPKRARWVLPVAGAAVVAVAVGGFFGVRALNDYRADIEAMQTSAQEYYDAAAEQQQLAREAAEEAQGYADAASESTDSLEAAEAEAEALAAAQAAQAAANVSNGLTPEGKCPAGTVAGEVNDDGTEGLCSPTGPGGRPCAEYTDNVCTAWLRE